MRHRETYLKKKPYDLLDGFVLMRTEELRQETKTYYYYHHAKEDATHIVCSEYVYVCKADLAYTNQVMQRVLFLCMY